VADAEVAVQAAALGSYGPYDAALKALAVHRRRAAGYNTPDRHPAAQRSHAGLLLHRKRLVFQYTPEI
jgi:hypothetical protein